MCWGMRKVRGDVVRGMGGGKGRCGDVKKCRRRCERVCGVSMESVKKCVGGKGRGRGCGER